MIDIPLQHIVFENVKDENQFYKANPGIHLVKAIVAGRTTHIWVATTPKNWNGGHMQAGGAFNNGT